MVGGAMAKDHCRAVAPAGDLMSINGGQSLFNRPCHAAAPGA